MRDKFLTLCAYFIWIASACVAFSYLLNANVSFWYDPARDLLSAWDSLHKVTLIGQPSGIPGFFYGPYWIWWLRVGLIFSKNPVVVTAITITIPYLLGFAGILWLFSKLFGKSVSILLWVLYFISFQGVMTQLWNPYVAPLFYLGVIYILIYWKNKIKNIQSSLPICFAGILTGLALNTHISFSVGFGLGCILFLILEKIFIFSKEKMDERIRQLFFSLCSFCVGIGLTFIPFFLFEIRHGFNQTRIAFNAFLHGGNVVLQHGLSKQDIVISFFGKFSELTKIPFSPAIVVLTAIGLTLILFAYRKKLSSQEVRLLLLLTTIAISVLLLYLVAKNPIWPYHFIGMDVIWLLFIGIFAKKLSIIRWIFLIWVICLSVWAGRIFIGSLHENPLTRGDLYTKEYIVRTIQKDAGSRVYTVYAYSPSIYTYEYNYLFRWIAEKEFSYDPRRIQRKGTVYLILPTSSKANLEDFVHFNTPDAFYKTAKTWQIPDGTVILKRTRKK